MIVSFHVHAHSFWKHPYFEAVIRYNKLYLILSEEESQYVMMIKSLYAG